MQKILTVHIMTYKELVITASTLTFTCLGRSPHRGRPKRAPPKTVGSCDSSEPRGTRHSQRWVAGS